MGRRRGVRGDPADGRPRRVGVRADGVFLVCTSTYGQGDVPDNSKKFYEDLQAKRPDLANVRYGVFGLGDRTYAETFNFGGMKFDGVARRARRVARIGERVQHDASLGVLPEEKAEEWAAGWSNRQGKRRRRPRSNRKTGGGRHGYDSARNSA